MFDTVEGAIRGQQVHSQCGVNRCLFPKLFHHPQQKGHTVTQQPLPTSIPELLATPILLSVSMSLPVLSSLEKQNQTTFVL